MNYKKLVRVGIILTSFIIVLLLPISNFYIKNGLVYITLNLLLLNIVPLCRTLKSKSISKYFIGILVGAILISLTILLLASMDKIRLIANENVNYLVIILVSLFWVIQSFFEEYLLRGIALEYSSKLIGIDLSILLTSFIFSLFHITNPSISILSLINIFLFGLLCGYLIKIYKNIYLVSGIHFIWNYLQGNLFGIEVSGNKISESIFSCLLKEGQELYHGGSFGVEGGIISSIVLFIATLVFILISLKNNTKETIYYLYNSIDNKFLLSSQKINKILINEENYLVSDLLALTLIENYSFILLEDLADDNITIDLNEVKLFIYNKIDLIEQWKNSDKSIKFINGNYLIRSSLNYEFDK